MLNLAIALALAVLTLFGGYAFWYILRGKRLREKKEQYDNKNNNSASPDSSETHDWGVDKDSYCYPKINDTMGYQFVTIIPVDPVLLGKENAKEHPAEGETKPAGGATNTTIKTISKDKDAVEALKEAEEAAYRGDTESGGPGRNEVEPSSSFGEKKPRPAQPAIPKEPDSFDSVYNGPWVNREEERRMSDDDLRAIFNSMDDSGDVENEDEEETTVTVKEEEQENDETTGDGARTTAELISVIENMNKTEIFRKSHSIMSAISAAAENDTEESGNDTGGQPAEQGNGESGTEIKTGKPGNEGGGENNDAFTQSLMDF